MPRKPRTSAQKNAGTNRATKTAKSVDRHRRFKEIETLLAEQHTGGEIVRTMADRHGLSERQCYLDLAEVYERCQAEDHTDHAVRIARARRAWARRMRRCEQLGEEQAANYALDRLCKLDGLYAPKKIEIGGTVTIGMRIQSIVKVLDADGLAALRVVQTQIERAKAAGLLTPGDDEKAAPEPAPATDREEP